MNTRTRETRSWAPSSPPLSLAVVMLLEYTSLSLGATSVAASPLSVVVDGMARLPICGDGVDSAFGGDRVNDKKEPLRNSDQEHNPMKGL